MARRRFQGSASWGYFPPRSTPRKARGGIKAQSQRGGFGATWWGKRWIENLESFDIGERLARGRSYARQGQVLSIAIEPGRVLAKVQGSRAKPYAVEVRIETIGKSGWKKLGKRLEKNPALVAGLFAGDLSEELEATFRDAKLSLFPARDSDIRTDCSCPDDSRPCKHVAAVCYLLAEELDRDPFLLLRLRGIVKEELVALLGGEPAAAELDSAPGPGPVEEPLPTDPAVFWGHAETSRPTETPAPTGASQAVHAALLRRLGAFPFWRGAERFLDALERVYDEARPRGLEIAAGLRRDEDESGT